MQWSQLKVKRKLKLTVKIINYSYKRYFIEIMIEFLKKKKFKYKSKKKLVSKIILIKTMKDIIKLR